MLVEADTIARLNRSDAAVRRAFVAGCAERVAQIFTGLRGPQISRSLDVETFVNALYSLWSGVSVTTYSRLLEQVERFEEFEPSEEGISDTAEIYAMYSALALRYALACAASDDPEFAVKCGHVMLTAMEQMDSAVPGNSFAEEERRFQARDHVTRVYEAEGSDLREECQASARKRYEALAARL
ncbi:hypothetical protein Q0Z83_098910 [Actinoplanes sichuanensis]|uniref:Uncharacterized protein n=1 Tax=Actinoplanes sichuanensis TaxID=512349 RepID=A0ABW4AG81_9ACTN|nr:hypothetical protein [Actinoplanes sichuanensis]BEL11700.1 hypothetical protein Q0Z83_098910 [Actinoplanes sichuanensis]